MSVACMFVESRSSWARDSHMGWLIIFLLMHLHVYTLCVLWYIFIMYLVLELLYHIWHIIITDTSALPPLLPYTIINIELAYTIATLCTPSGKETLSTQEVNLSINEFTTGCRYYTQIQCWGCNIDTPVLFQSYAHVMVADCRNLVLGVMNTNSIHFRNVCEFMKTKMLL